MGRNWSPHYKVKCSACGWKGTRTERMMSKLCPKCKGWNKMVKGKSV